jgi:hypothetical protein
MIDLELWEKQLREGLEGMRQQAAELAVRIHRQEGALMVVVELKKEQAEQPADVVAEVEPVA